MVYENKQDWPEKYDINKLVTRQNDIQKIIDGDKTSERRNDRYADPGDELVLNGQTFVVANIYPQKLKTITDEEAKQEGYSSLEEYKDAINSIHEGEVWEPEGVIWAHELKKQ
ncbi:hypothetical protein GCM10028778_13230 [Barrientosiimonas marina]|uniref:ASCH domain-containing protein n=1 Tax=Lentibacillus kimchii TaxID=1542911 RepID=A0ABW2UUS1_9BACI